MGSPYDETTHAERHGMTRGKAAPSLGKPATLKRGMPTEPNWMGALPGPKRKVFKSFGRKVKERVHEDF